jgi:hypothetical protein
MNGNLPAVVKAAINEQRVNLDQVNLMLPTQTFGEVLGMYDKVTIEVVTIDTSKTAGEVFEIGGKKSLGRVPLEKISSAVGIIWDPVHTTILESSSTKSRAKATGALRKPNGEFIVLSEEKTVDLEAIEEEQRLKTEDDAKRGKVVEVNGQIQWEHTEGGKAFPKREPFRSEQEKADWINREVRKAMISYRKFKDERAMTGAKERCIRALLALKSSYTDAELAKPFAFPRVLPDVNKMLADPAVRQAAIERMSGAVTSIFGPGRGERDITPPRSAIGYDAGMEIPAEEVREQPVDDDPFDEKGAGEVGIDPKEKARLALEEWLHVDALKPSAKKVIRELLDYKDATMEALQNMLDRCAAYEQRQAAKVGAK